MNAHVAAEVVIPPKLQVPSRPLVRIVIVGHVDHGKSTLIGRLLSETGSLPDGKLDELKAVSTRRGMPFEWSFLLDALQTERDQGITIDTSQIRFRTPAREFVLIDAPGHAEFLRNMVTGASQADAALLLVDVAEGVREQTLRHVYLLHLLGIREVVVVINKMDRVGYDDGRFREIDAEITAHLADLGLKPAAVIPISARHGDGVVERTPAIGWYRGPTVIEALDRFAPERPATALPLRLPVQAVYRFDDRRIVAGRIQSGFIAVGDEIAVAPSGRRAVVRSIETWPGNDGAGPRHAGAGQSVGIMLDRELFIARGDMIAPAQRRSGMCLIRVTSRQRTATPAAKIISSKITSATWRLRWPTRLRPISTRPVRAPGVSCLMSAATSRAADWCSHSTMSPKPFRLPRRNPRLSLRGRPLSIARSPA